MQGRKIERCAKRALDLSVAAGGLVLGAPLLLVVGGLIRRELGSPVLFRQERPGLEERPFTMLKFRTMREPGRGEARLASDHARLTPLGRWLRSTSLDELPTLWNVLRGEMSLVGPRPLLMEYLGRYTPAQRRRHLVKPGVTGWAVVNGRNAISWEQKFELDVWYVDHWSLGLDLHILSKTLLAVLRREGVSHGGHATMPEFKGQEHARAEAPVSSC